MFTKYVFSKLKWPLSTLVVVSMPIFGHADLIYDLNSQICNYRLEGSPFAPRLSRLLESGVLQIGQEAKNQRSLGLVWPDIKINIDHIRGELERMKNGLVAKNEALDQRLIELGLTITSVQGLDEVFALRRVSENHLNEWLSLPIGSLVSLDEYNKLSYEFLASIDQVNAFPNGPLEHWALLSWKYKTKPIEAPPEGFIHLPYQRGFHPEVDLLLFAHGLLTWEVALQRRSLDGVAMLRSVTSIAEHDYGIHHLEMAHTNRPLGNSVDERENERIRVYNLLRSEIFNPLRSDKKKYELSVFLIYWLVHEIYTPLNFKQMAHKIELALKLTQMGSINEFYSRIMDKYDFGGGVISKLAPTQEEVIEAAVDLHKKLSILK